MVILVRLRTCLWTDVAGTIKHVVIPVRFSVLAGARRGYSSTGVRVEALTLLELKERGMVERWGPRVLARHALSRPVQPTQPFRAMC